MRKNTPNVLALLLLICLERPYSDCVLEAMKTPMEYWELAEHYWMAAAATSDPCSRNQLKTLADSYSVIAESTAVLNRTAKILRSLECRQNGTSPMGPSKKPVF